MSRPATSYRDLARGPALVGDPAIDLAALERAVTEAEPSAVLVPRRLLRRVILRDRGEWFSGRREARQTSYVIAGPTLASIVDDGDLPRPNGAPWPSTVILLLRPDPDDLADSTPESVLLDAWRRLFRARVRAAVKAGIDRGGMGGGGAIEVASRVRAIGRTEFEEVRLVLRQVGLIAVDEPDDAAYVEFAGVFLEQTYFAPGLRAHAFPAIEDHDAIAATLARDADGSALFAATRPKGAPDPGATPAIDQEHDHENEPEADRDREVEPVASDATTEPATAARLAAKAERESSRGNVVGAAILWVRASRLVGPSGGDAERNLAMGALGQLARRIQLALFLRADEADEWTAALAPLLRRAARGFWVPEARLLYDLQTVCLDHERETFRLDLLGWAFSLGKKPLKTPLPHVRELAISSHLRGAVLRLPKVKLTREDRIRLESLLRPAVSRAELALRESFRPRIESTLEAHWVRPANLPERIAREKLVEELLDQIVKHGYLSLGDLRDAASRSNLKLPDLTGAAEFFEGGRLLETDRALASALDGVHRRGEVYLRWLQRFSALASGTKTGRWIALFVALPYGGAFVVLKGIHHLLEAGSALFHGPQFPLEGWPLVWAVLLLGSLALGVINYVRFRCEFLALMRALGRSLRAVFVDLPSLLLYHPLLRRILESRAAEAVWRLGFKPGVAGVVAYAAARAFRTGHGSTLATAAVAFAGASFLINTRFGRSLEEAVIEVIVRAWRSLAYNFVPGLFRLVMWTFERVVEYVERLFYAVDEWLRFREGQSQGWLLGKAVLGLFWFGVAYLARIYVNLLIEPQINPIKHFPVVTVSHKIIIPLSVQLTKHLSIWLTPFIGEYAAWALVGINVLLLPGVFGFLVWELKANWRLYAANRRASLGPVMVGSHGETVVRLLRPGLHSGTLPKLYAKLRRSEPKARKGLRVKAALKQREALHHVEEAVRRFVERDFLALLRQTRALGAFDISLGTVRLAANRIRVELADGEEKDPSLWLDLEERQGVLAAGASQAGWLDRLNDEERRALDLAVVGLFKMSGVGLVHTPGDPLDEPETAADGAPGRTPRLAFAEIEIPWDGWVAAWEDETAGKPLPEGPPVLPQVEAGHAV